MKYIDLTQTFTADMPVFPGDTKPTLEQTSHLGGDNLNDQTITTGMHVGTHMDAPLHAIEGGKMISDLPIEQFFGPGIFIDVKGQKTIDISVLKERNIEAGSIVLFYTDLGNKFREKNYFNGYPELTENLAEELIKRKVKMIGTDSPSAESMPPWPIHKLLLGADVLLLENLTNLGQLVGLQTFEIIALPPKLASNGAPVRVIARVDQ